MYTSVEDLQMFLLMNVLCSLKGGQKKTHRSTYLLSPTIPDPDYDSGKDSDSRESDGKDSSTAWDSDGNKNASPPRRRDSSCNADRRLWSSDGRPASVERYDSERLRNRYDSDRRSSEEKDLEEEGTERRRVRKEGKKREEKGRRKEEEEEEKEVVKRRPVKGQERRESSSSGASR
jgi:hypothetical protein